MSTLTYAEHPVSAQPSAAPNAALTPIPPRAAMAILGTMILLIIGLTAILVQTTWIEPVGSADALAVETERLARR